MCIFSVRGMRPQRAFTIIELMVTVVILGILATLAVPSFNDLIASTRIKNAASDIYASLALARSEALKRNANVTVGPIVAGDPWENGWRVAVGGTVLNTQGAVPNLRIECPAGTTCLQTLTYGGNGRLTTSAATLNVDVLWPTTPPRVPKRCVDVSLSGRVNVTVDNNRDGSCANG